ncbi:hypothetical protein [Saccharicrinis sp. 156]|uniref:hypothetical protein n=1 Tax=Saccharicrinis sp. 156 TaxID=3417574 RepID=UPI003D33741E
MIFYLFHESEKSEKVDTRYIDLFASGSMKDLIKIIADRILDKFYKLNILTGLSFYFNK